jgi:hypothetical protein
MILIAIAASPAAADFSIDVFSPTIAIPTTPHAPDDILTSSFAVGGPFLPEDAGGPGPVVHVTGPALGFGGLEVDALSLDLWGGTTPFGLPLAILFSVDPLAVGAACGAVNREAALDEAAGDVFEAITHHYPIVPPPFAQPMPGGPPSRPPFGPGKNLLSPPVLLCPSGIFPAESGGDHRNLSLVPTPPGPAPIADNLDALDCYHAITPDVYTSLTGATGLPMPPGFLPADIIISFPLGTFVYAPAPVMGLDINGPGTDDIDALVVFEMDGLFERPRRGVDFALFSLRAGSATLGATGMAPGDVFITDFSGGFDIFAYAVELGLAPADDLDGLTLGLPQAPPIVCADFDGDGDVDLSDFALFAACFGGAASPPAPGCPPGIDTDLDNDGDADISDFAIFAACFGGAGNPVPPGCPPGC